MKIKSQIGLLLALPLLSQIVFCVVIVQTMQKTEAAGRKAAEAKQVLYCCQNMREIVVSNLSLLAARRFTDQAAGRQIRRIFVERIRRQMLALRELLRGDAGTNKIVDAYEKDIQTFVDLVRDYSESYVASDTHFMSRFIHEGEYLEEVMSIFNQIVNDEKLITSRYEPVVVELQPASVQGRERLQQLFIATVVFNSLLVAVLTFVFNRSTAKRLQMLMQNIHSFARGNVGLQPLGGQDELGELDRNFRDMARARLALEELQQAMYGMVSHDLRGPLTTIQIQLELMTRDPRGFEEQKARANVQLIASEVSRLIRLCNSFLDFQQMERNQIKLNIEAVPALEIVEPSVQAVNATARLKGVEVVTAVQSGCFANCDRDRVVQVLVNLLVNAVKFSPRNSRVELNVHMRQSTIRIEVIDSGSAIPEGLRNRLFQPYSQLAQPENVQNVGTGLGLYLSKMLTEAQGGTIGFEHKSGGEKCFWLELPRSEAPAVGTADPASGESESPPPMSP